MGPQRRTRTGILPWVSAFVVSLPIISAAMPMRGHHDEVGGMFGGGLEDGLVGMAGCDPRRLGRHAGVRRGAGQRALGMGGRLALVGEKVSVRDREGG